MLREPIVEKKICIEEVVDGLEDDKQEIQHERDDPPEKFNSETKNINEGAKEGGKNEGCQSFLVAPNSDMMGVISSTKSEEIANIENEQAKYPDETIFLENKISNLGCNLQIQGTSEETTGIVGKIENSKDEILETEESTTKSESPMFIDNSQQLSPNDLVEQTFDKMYGIIEGNVGNENKILENEPILSDEKLVSISRQSSADEGRQNALLFLVIVTLLAILIQALYNLFFTA